PRRTSYARLFAEFGPPKGYQRSLNSALMIRNRGGNLERPSFCSARQHATGTNATRAASSSRTGPLQRGTEEPVRRLRHTRSCTKLRGPAWKWQSKRRSFRRFEKRTPWAASSSQDFFPGGLP